ncbi:hypothetical protein VPHD479_0133 [Vibrio phage D479]
MDDLFEFVLRGIGYLLWALIEVLACPFSGTYRSMSGNEASAWLKFFAALFVIACICLGAYYLVI